MKKKMVEGESSSTRRGGTARSRVYVTSRPVDDVGYRRKPVVRAKLAQDQKRERETSAFSTTISEISFIFVVFARLLLFRDLL